MISKVILSQVIYLVHGEAETQAQNLFSRISTISWYYYSFSTILDAENGINN